MNVCAARSQAPLEALGDRPAVDVIFALVDAGRAGPGHDDAVDAGRALRLLLPAGRRAARRGAALRLAGAARSADAVAIAEIALERPVRGHVRLAAAHRAHPETAR